jgi:hypothetical protein
MRLYLKKTHHKKRAGEVAQGVDPEFKSQYHTHTQKKRNSLGRLFGNFYIDDHITHK